MMYDTIIRGGVVVDGTRLPRVRADVGIRNGLVCKVGRLDRATAERTIDAAGCIVAPGFVDLHTHYDAQLHWDPYCTMSGWHGVTTLVVGNCGFGFAPVKPADRERVMLMMASIQQTPIESIRAGMPWSWETFPEWLDNLAQLPKGVNVVSCVPLNPLLIYVMGLKAAKSRPATAAERNEMRRLLNEAMDAGAGGFSLQRLGRYSNQVDCDGTPIPTHTMADEDILALAEILRDRDAGYIQITQAGAGAIANLGPGVRERDWAFLERLAAAARRPIIHNAVQVIDGMPAFHRDELAWVHRANEKGLNIIAQGVTGRIRYNFTLQRWNLYDRSPAWSMVTKGAITARRQMMSDSTVRAQMKAEHQVLALAGVGVMPENCTVRAVPGNPELEQRYVGRVIREIATAEAKHPTDVLLDIALASDELRARFETECTSGTDPDEVGSLASDPYVTPGVSDGGAQTKVFTGGSYTTDLLTWLVRDTQKLSLEEAHYHLSCLPAQAAGLVDRGFLRTGASADIVIYDLQKLQRVPDWSYETLHDSPGNEWRIVERADGYRYTLVNGVVTFEDGNCTGATPGKLLRNGSACGKKFAVAVE